MKTDLVKMQKVLWAIENILRGYNCGEHKKLIKYCREEREKLRKIEMQTP